MKHNPEEYTVFAMPLNISGAEQIIRGPIIIEGKHKGWQYCLLKDGVDSPGGWFTSLYRLSRAPEDVRSINWFDK